MSPEATVDEAPAGVDQMPTYPMHRTCPFEPPKPYAELRPESPICRVMMPDGKRAWLITSHVYARELLLDERSSSNRTNPGFPELVPGLHKLVKQGTGFLSWMDPPEHSVHRRRLTGEFTLRRVKELRPRLQQITDDAVTAMLAAGPPADLVQAVSYPVPSLVVCELLGVDYEDRAFFQDQARIMADRKCDGDQRSKALGDLRGFLDRLVSQREQNPQDDLISRMIGRYREAGEYDHDHMAGLTMLLLIAGHESTANMISLGAVALLRHPETLEQFRTDPSVARVTVEELLRFFSISDPITSRVATADITIGGFTIREGEGMVIPNAAANRDPDVFDQPDAFNIHRDARRHFAFGYGAHQCLGQHLARLELEIAYTTLFSRVPSLRLAVPFEELPFKDDAMLFGIHEVPITW
jgi:cytochrome P450